MKLGIITILLAIILTLIPCLPALAQDSGTITITMTGAKEFSINLTPANWSFGTVSPNTPYETDLTQFNLTVDPTSNCNVNTFITSEDAVCVDDSAYVWTLSSDGSNGERVYALWFKIAKDVEHGYPEREVLIPKVSEGSPGEEFWPWSGGSCSSLTPGESVNFELKLLTPYPDFTEGGIDYFSVGDAMMQTHVTISAVAA